MGPHWEDIYDDEGWDEAVAKTGLPTGQTPDDSELRRILLTENGGSVSAGIGGVYAYAAPPLDQWIPGPQEFYTVSVPPLTEEMVKDLLARVQRLEQQVADLVAKKPKPRVRRKKPA
jgi:hypothetical protein